MGETQAVKRPHWYHTDTTECVICGRQIVYRERRYDEKPDDPAKRYAFQQDACDVHFL